MKSNSIDLSQKEVEYLLSPKAIREKATEIYQFTMNDKGSFRVNSAKLRPTVEFVLKVIHKNYPSLEIPFHSRWGHFKAGKIDRANMFDQLLGAIDPLEKVRAKLDLVITSVLLDAGAGREWSYLESDSKKSFNRSEGLGVASFHMFCSGVMSSDRKSLKADKKGLAQVSQGDLEKHFQVSATNPLVGVAGRVLLLNGLAMAMENKNIFKEGRPGNIVDYLQKKFGQTIPATGILNAVLEGFGSIWPGRLFSRGINLGDVWRHSKVGFVPIHKLSQWLTYSLIEPIQEAGFKVTGVEELTGLAEYRNGGLLLDSGLLEIKNSTDLNKPWTPDSDLIIEWRALTIYFLDQIGVEVQRALGKSPSEFPLAKVLEGGTWWAGRMLAEEKRAGATPPLNIQSDGTVF